MGKRRGKRAVWIGGILVAALPAAVLWFVGSPVEPPLLARASFVAAVGALTPPNADLGSCRWVSARKIEFCGPIPGGWLASCLELPQRTVTMSRGNRNRAAGWGYENIAPDGRWLLIRDYRANSSVFAAYPLAGGPERRRWTLPISPAFSCWLPDSSGWLELVYGPDGKRMQTVIHSLNGQEEKGPLTTIDLGTPIGITPDRHLHCVMLVRGRTLPLYDYDLTGHTPMRAGSVTIPGDAVWYEAALSERGDRIAYLLHHWEQPVPPILHWLFPHNNPNRLRKVSLWVSRIDGSEMHEIGSYAVGLNGPTPRAVQWTPDGKRISFLHAGNLYTVPAD